MIMPAYPNRQFLEFEQPIKDLYEQIDATKKLAEKNPKIDLSATVAQLEKSIVDKRKAITESLSPWQRVQLSRHPDRPYTLKYIHLMCDKFIELHGDRNVKDDKAMVGGFTEFNGQTVMMIGQQKGSNTKARQMRNFGMANPEGYRKALRLMKLAEKFDKPVVCLIDTPGLGEDEDCETDKNYISLVKSQVNMSQIDAIIYVTRLNETRFRGEEKKILKLLIESFDSRLWQSAWLVFTFSASVLPLERDKVTQKRKEQIESHVKDCLLAKGAKTFQGFTVKLRVDNIKRNWAENSTSVISILAK